MELGGSLVENTSYFAFRRRSGAVSDAWWSAARRRPDLPASLIALVAGRARVEVSRVEAVETLAWAERVDGLAVDQVLAVYPHDPRVD